MDRVWRKLQSPKSYYLCSVLIQEVAFSIFSSECMKYVKYFYFMKMLIQNLNHQNFSNFLIYCITICIHIHKYTTDGHTYTSAMSDKKRWR